ncbi:transposase [Rhodococcus sp. NPDC060086]|uniref:transposase n=1 Tax=Rhodococcus sp. NPDC060086 TaxID=3347055 RepID=UPI0036552389
MSCAFGVCHKIPPGCVHRTDLGGLREDHAEHLSRYLWGGHLWSRSYYCGTAGGAPLSVIAEYVTSQRRPE